MAEEQKSQGWWPTVPGILTVPAGIITAIAGLIAALHQAGVFTSPPRQVRQPPSRNAANGSAAGRGGKPRG